MGRKKEFGMTLYNRIKRDSFVPCIENSCKGKIKYIRTRYEKQDCEDYFEYTLFYRCTRNCRHHWKAVGNNLEKRLIFVKY